MRIACVQKGVAFNDPATNLASALVQIDALAAQGAELIVFPEAFLTGYCVSSLEEAKSIAIPAPCASWGQKMSQ